MKGKLFIIDGHALIFKMYYAFLRRPMINSKGMDTSILFGFTKYILELLDRERPSHFAVAFDPPGGTFRNEMYPAYKANRPPTPQLVIDALEPLTELCREMNIPVLMVKGFEADDVIGTMAKKAAREGLTVYMVTPDKDYGQLIAPYIFQYKPGKSGGDDEIIGVREICEKHGIIDPIQVIDMLTICGDAADNVPGVNGIGEVGAGKLVSKYGSIENIYAHAGELSEKQQAMLEQARGHIALSKKLVTVKTDVPLDIAPADLVYSGHFNERISELFNFYEFNSLRRFLRDISAGEAKASSTERPSIRPGSEAELREAASKAGRMALDYVDGSLTAVCAAADGTFISCDNVPQDLLEDGNIDKCGYDLKKALGDGISLEGKLMDVQLMHYLLNPERSHELGTLAEQYLGFPLEESEAPASLFDEGPSEGDRVLRCAAMLLLAEKLAEAMEKAGVSKLYSDIEEPLIRVLSRMEKAGVKIDLDSLKDFAESLRAEIAEKEALVREISGEPALNVSSPKQLGEVLFEKMKLDPKAKKPSRGSWSTDEETLSALSDRSPIIEAILDYRAAKKLLSTYIEPFPGYVSPRDGRVHTTFNQALTATGRLSSSNPNLQNIPVRTERGKSIRAAFVPQDPSRCVIMAADYSQIELRIMAHLCGDKHLLAAFAAGEDVHAATAAKIFGVPVSEVTSDQRRVAKTANFGIMYGISAFGLAQRLGSSRSEAKAIIDGYFESFPAIRGFIDRTLEQARSNGYVETLFGRRRYLPDLSSHNANLRAFAERNAVNAPIQGTSADIIKLAMIGVDRGIRAEKLKARMILQIHDELVFEVPFAEIEVLRDIVVSEMENVIKLSVPLTVECKYGKNWLEAH